MGGTLLAERAVDPAMLERLDDFRHAVLSKFNDVLVGAVGDRIEPALCRSLLAASLALISSRPAVGDETPAFEMHQWGVWLAQVKRTVNSVPGEGSSTGLPGGAVHVHPANNAYARIGRAGPCLVDRENRYLGSRPANKPSVTSRAARQDVFHRARHLAVRLNSQLTSLQRTRFRRKCCSSQCSISFHLGPKEPRHDPPDS